MSELAYFRCEADGKIYVFEEPASYTVGWRRVTEAEYNKQQAAKRLAPTVSRKLQDIRQAVAALKFARSCVLDDEANGILDGTNANQDRVHDAELAIYAHAEDWLTDLLAIAEAAQAVRAVRHDLIIDPIAALNNPQLETRLGNATRAMNELMTLVAKLERE